MQHINLETFANGAFTAQVNRAIEEVTKNIQDPNTDAGTARKITATIAFKPNQERNFIATGVQTKTTLAPALGAVTALSMATMVSRMRQPLKRLVWTLTGRNFRGLENIITVDGNLEDRRARLNMQEIWLSSWMNCMNSMKTGSFIFFWIHLQKVWRKR